MAKKLVAFFSVTGKTSYAAHMLAEASGADLYEIKPVKPYTRADLDWMDKRSRTSREMSDPSFRPEIAGGDAHISDYDVIFIGFPVWWSIAPSIINTFVESYNFSGKKIVLFATAGGSGFGFDKAISNLQKSAPKAKIIGSKVLNGEQDPASLSEWAEKF
ncbi:MULTISPECIES: flavodoxin [unclassified Treponema]|uniref:flavodoxin n=1 Tax=Treponema TaxID=157 RepID=UPI0016529A72|nr:MULTISPECIES: flavodoxin [unclassified Treponema]MBC6719202.1 NAD(P)H-dependent oxidoreductase [Treponema sp. Marseille-Q4130]MBM7022192.1 NAD(P)H-dependent oxidoreductase [Treponema sp. Marseille-Q4523]